MSYNQFPRFIEIQVPVSSSNLLSIAQVVGQLPKTGLARIVMEGFGGSGGGGGGQAGTTAGSQGFGGGGSGGCQWQVASFDFDLSHVLAIVVGVGGAAGAAGTGAAGPGGNGAD